jgi:hypothetical protein
MVAFVSRKSKSKTEIAPSVRRWVQRLALFGPPPLLEGEDPATYDQLLARICEAVQPVDIIYEMLIANAVSLEWEVLRYRRLKWSLIRESVREALHHCRPCRRLSRSHQAERTHRRHGPARECHQGSLSLERVDLTLLSIDERKLPIYLQMRRLSLCENQPWPGEPVIVAVPEGTARSHVMLPALLPANQKKFSTVISDVATTGNSGSGVFDAGQKCLLGIMSRKITVRPNTATGKAEEKDIAKYFVPASTIRAFIPTTYRF